jgi:hypothetical protein
MSDLERLERSADMQPIEDAVELDLPAEALWNVFQMPDAWPKWNPCFTWVRNRYLTLGDLLVWAFEPIRPQYLYRMPAIARIVELEDGQKVSWDVTAFPGMYARHTYQIEAVGEGRCRFSSWEKAVGPGFRAFRNLWLAHFRFVCASSLSGARALEQRYLRDGSFQGLLAEFERAS